MITVKECLLDQLKEQIQASKAFLIVKYEESGIGKAQVLSAKAIAKVNKAEKFTAKTSHEFHRAVTKSGGEFEVVSKRIFGKAAQEVGKATNESVLTDLDMNAYDGSLGIVFANQDPLETTKATFNFMKNLKDVLTVLGGFFDRKLYSGSEMEALSKLPSLNEMRAQFLGLLEAPMAQTLAVMDAVLTSVPYCLANKAKQTAEPGAE